MNNNGMPIFPLDLGCWMQASNSLSSFSPHHLDLGSMLLRHSISLHLPGCMAAVLDLMIAQNIPVGDLIHSFVGSSQGRGHPILHHILTTGNMELIKTLVDWSEENNIRLKWSLPCGPCGLNPLHLAVLLPNAMEVITYLFGSHLLSGYDAASAWLLDAAVTPANLASEIGLSKCLDSLARDTLIRASPLVGIPILISDQSEDEATLAESSEILGLPSDEALVAQYLFPFKPDDTHQPTSSMVADTKEICWPGDTTWSNANAPYTRVESSRGCSASTLPSMTLPPQSPEDDVIGWRSLLWGFSTSAEEENYLAFKVNYHAQGFPLEEEINV